MNGQDSEWLRKGMTLSDKTARKAFGLMLEEVIQAIRARKLQYRAQSIYGNPFLRVHTPHKALAPEASTHHTMPFSGSPRVIQGAPPSAASPKVR